jgi:hypothetical protein
LQKKFENVKSTDFVENYWDAYKRSEEELSDKTESDEWSDA